MTLDEARDFALSLPETTEQPHFELSSFRVRGKIFTTVPPDSEHLHVFVGEDLIDAAVAHDAAAYEELWWGKRRRGVRIRLSAADADMVRDLIEDAWRCRAPKGLVNEFDAKSEGPQKKGL